MLSAIVHKFPFLPYELIKTNNDTYWFQPWTINDCYETNKQVRDGLICCSCCSRADEPVREIQYIEMYFYLIFQSLQRKALKFLEAEVIEEPENGLKSGRKNEQRPIRLIIVAGRR